MVVYVVVNSKTRRTKVGFTDQFDIFVKQLQKEDKAWTVLVKENYTAKKNAMIRVKQLKNNKNK